MTELGSPILTEIRGAGLHGSNGTAEYRALRSGTPIILQREPTNRADTNAIIAMTATLQPCGYIARQTARQIATELDRGVLWLAQVVQPPRAFHYPQARLWRKVGWERRYREILRENGAGRALIKAVFEGKYLHSLSQRECTDRVAGAFQRYVDSLDDPPRPGEQRYTPMLTAFRWGWENL